MNATSATENAEEVKVKDEKPQILSDDAQVDQTLDEPLTEPPKAETTETEIKPKEPEISGEETLNDKNAATNVSSAPTAAADDEGDDDDEEEKEMVVDEDDGQEEPCIEGDAEASKDAPSINSLDQQKLDEASESEYPIITETDSQTKSEISTESAPIANHVEPSASLASNSSSESTSSMNDETKANYRFRPPESWSVDEVEQFITSTGFPQESSTFKEQEIDGKSLLLLKRQDVLTGLGFKLGPALKLYSFIHHLQNFNLVTVLPTPPGSVTAESIVDQESNSVASNVNSNTTASVSMTTTPITSGNDGVTTTVYSSDIKNSQNQTEITPTESQSTNGEDINSSSVQNYNSSLDSIYVL